MRVYIASRYARHRTNRRVCRTLEDAGFEVFLPEHIERRVLDQETAKAVFRRCISELDKADVLLAISPYGVDVGSEITHAFERKQRGLLNSIVQLNTDETTSRRHDFIRCMIDYESHSLDDIVRYLRASEVVSTSSPELQFAS